MCWVGEDANGLMFVIVRLQVGHIVLVVMRTMLRPVVVIVSCAIGPMAVLMRMRVAVRMAVLMGVFVGMGDAAVGMFVGVGMLMQVLVLVRVLVLPFHSWPQSAIPVRLRN